MNIDEKAVPLRNAEGNTRRLGFELEFSGIDLQAAASLIKKCYGGEVTKMHRYRYKVTDTEYGIFRVELDARNLRRLAQENAFTNWGIDFEEEERNYSLEVLLDRLAQSVVPLEIVMPPVPLNRIEDAERLRDALQQNKAKGTGTSLMHAFGMHINIECPSLDAPMLLRYLRSFVLLYHWLLHEHQIDVTRKITPFVDRFPDDYVRLLLDINYRPGIDRLIDDYLHHNPTRNRPLDMMPVWEMLAPERVRAALPDEKNEPRPTFHYRLPNSHINDPKWRLKDELDCWMAVERLAADPEMVQKLSRLYLLQLDRTIIPFQKHWIETVTILQDLDA